MRGHREVTLPISRPFLYLPNSTRDLVFINQFYLTNLNAAKIYSLSTVYQNSQNLSVWLALTHTGCLLNIVRFFSQEFSLGRSGLSAGKGPTNRIDCILRMCWSADPYIFIQRISCCCEKGKNIIFYDFPVFTITSSQLLP